jgi:hypothetical protein
MRRQRKQQMARAVQAARGEGSASNSHGRGQCKQQMARAVQAARGEGSASNSHGRGQCKQQGASAVQATRGEGSASNCKQQGATGVQATMGYRSASNTGEGEDSKEPGQRKQRGEGADNTLVTVARAVQAIEARAVQTWARLVQATGVIRGVQNSGKVYSSGSDGEGRRRSASNSHRRRQRNKCEQQDVSSGADKQTS